MKKETEKEFDELFTADEWNKHLVERYHKILNFIDTRFVDKKVLEEWIEEEMKFLYEPDYELTREGKAKKELIKDLKDNLLK